MCAGAGIKRAGAGIQRAGAGIERGPVRVRVRERDGGTVRVSSSDWS